MVFKHAAALRQHCSAVHTESGVLRQRKREQHFAKWLETMNMTVIRNKSIYFKHLDQDNESCVHLDFYIVRADGTVFVVELDEFQHDHRYPASCESMRAFRVRQALEKEINGSPMVFTRLNPDTHRVNGKIQYAVSLEQRYETFKTLYDTLPKPTQPLTVQYMYYDIDAEGVLECSKQEGFVRCLLDVCLPPIV